MYNHPDGKLFQKPVSKSQARDYYDVIKNPMDLSRMLKKIKTMQYSRKEDFRADFELMWSNCATYNTDPSHFARKAASNVKAYTDDLLLNVPSNFELKQSQQQALQQQQQLGAFSVSTPMQTPLPGSVETPVSAFAYAAAAQFAAEDRGTEAAVIAAASAATPAPETSTAAAAAPSVTTAETPSYKPLDTIRLKSRHDVLTAPLTKQEEQILQQLSMEQRTNIERDLSSIDVFDTDTRWHILT